RRNIGRLKRFSGTEMTRWPVTDANLILIAEILLMTAFLTMNAADQKLQLTGISPYVAAGSFPISSWLMPLMPEHISALIWIERSAWWFHITGVFVFLTYLA